MLSEGELHVQAMRLVCEALADRENTGLEVDWDVINQQLDHMDVILQGIADQRRDDAGEIEILKKERNAAYENVSTVRDEVAAEIETLRKDRDHWKTARQDAIEAGELMQAEIESLRKQLADAKQEQVDTYDDYEGQIASAEALIDPEANGETTIAGMADQILHLRKQLADAQRAASDEFVERQVLTAEQQQRDEIAYLRERLDEERSVSARFLRKLAELESNSSVTLTGSPEPEGGK